MKGQMRVRLLGGFEAQQSNEQEIAFRSDSGRALLAYLLLEKDRAHRRESLGILLWPDMEEKQARNNLRVALHRVRQAIADAELPVIEATNQTVQIREDAPVWVDVWAFEAALEEVEAHGHSSLAECKACLGRLEEAVALYRGPFLKGFLLENSQPFVEWVVLKQEWLHRQMLETLSELTESHIELGAYEDAEAYARRQIGLEAWREKAHRQLMHVLALRGERGAALAQYESCRSVLEEELGVPPSDATEELVDKIRSTEVYGAGQKILIGIGESGRDKGQPWRRWFFGFAGAILLILLSVVGFRGFWNGSNNLPEGSIRWEFEDSKDLEGWLPLYDLEPLMIENGSLHLRSTGGDPYFSFPSGFSFDAETLSQMEIRMKVSDGNSAEVFFRYEGEVDFLEGKSLIFLIVPDDSFHTYTLDMSTVATWEGVIGGLRLDPADTVATIEIDYIRILPELNQ